MKTFRNNNNRRFRFRNNDRNYKRNGDGKKFNSPPIPLYGNLAKADHF